MEKIFRGNLYYADLEPVIGSEQGGIRPVLIVQNNTGNKYSPTVIIAPITSQINVKSNLPTHITIKAFGKIKYDSIILIEQVRVVDKKRLLSFLGHLDIKEMENVNKAILIAFGIDNKELDSLF
ncbi:MAG: type II toxin-antitoxin system PemK/MazF family toxin [Candidatus Nanoarchaeia archaeon]|nr:type II toxin-antitoxin system PemK/MazF family toxin [Candidatus Nanoarchaeia archaeon]